MSDTPTPREAADTLDDPYRTQQEDDAAVAVLKAHARATGPAAGGDLAALIRRELVIQRDGLKNAGGPSGEPMRRTLAWAIGMVDRLVSEAAAPATEGGPHPFDAIADGIDALPAMVPGVCMPGGQQIDQLTSWLRWTPCRDAVVPSAVPASLAATAREGGSNA